MSKFAVVSCALLGLGLTVGSAAAQGIGGAWVPGYYYGYGYYPFGGAWETAEYAQSHTSAAEARAARRTEKYEAAVGQRVDAARQADIQRNDQLAASVRAANARAWTAEQANEEEDRHLRQLAAAEARRVTQERQAIVRNVTGAWKQFVSTGGREKTLPTDFGGTLVAHGPTAGAEPVTRAVVPAVRAARGADVRANFRESFLFTAAWFREHPGAWKPEHWARAGDTPNGADAAWHSVSWAGLVRWLGWNVKPINFDYGINITIQDGVVFRNQVIAATEENYYQQTVALARREPGDRPAASEWLPLGVFALVPEGQTAAHGIMHLAVSKSGLIRGNYYDMEKKVTRPLRGAVDRETQRVAGTPGDRLEIIFEAGLYNLTLDATPALVYPGNDKAQQWLMVRLKPPEELKPATPARQEAPPPEGSARASLEVHVPADAAVWFDGYKSKQVGPVRKFSTPPLPRGEQYAYDIRVRWTQDGAPVEQTRTVAVRAGERVRVEFPAPGS